MPEVQNVGAVNYAQYQPQPQAQYDEYADYNTQPEFYDENYAQMQETSKFRLGAITTAIIATGVGVGCYFWGNHGKKAAETAKKAAETALEELNKSEAVKNYEKLKEVTEKAIADVEGMAKKGAGERWGAERCGNGFYEKLQEFFKPVKENIEKAKTEAKNAEKAAEEAKDTAKEAGDKAKKEAE